MRRCNIPPSTCRHPDRAPCCKDCEDREDCSVRCENSPERCKCWADKPPRRRRESYKVSPLQVAYLYGQKGLTHAEIARQLGCERATVSNILRRMEAGKHGQA